MSAIAPSRRLDGISEYYFATKLREIAQLRSEGKSILNLGIGSPDQAPDPAVSAALTASAALPHTHGYQSYTGLPALRKAWAGWYSRYYNVDLNPEKEILPLIGSKEGIMHIAMSFLDPGDVALVPNPGYPTYRAATLLAGGIVQEYPLCAGQNWLPDLEALEQTDLSRVKIMWVNYPHMPTGAQATQAVFQQIVDFGIKHKILIVNDNPYSFILNDRPVSILVADGADRIALELNSLSKSHNMAGWRVGMVAGNSAYVQEVLRFKSNMDSGQFLPAQEAAIEALNLPDRWYQSLNAEYRRRQTPAYALLEAAGCTAAPDQKGMFVWAGIPDHVADGYALSDHLLYQAGVFLTPGGIFGDAGNRYIRLSLCSPEAVLQDALKRVQALFSTNALPLINA